MFERGDYAREIFLNWLIGQFLITHHTLQPLYTPETFETLETIEIRNLKLLKQSETI